MKGMTDSGVWRRDGQFVLQVLRTHRFSTIEYSASASRFCTENQVILEYLFLKYLSCGVMNFIVIFGRSNDNQ